MKVLFPFIGDSIGGSHVSSLILFRELVRQNIDVKIVIQKPGLLESYLKNNGITPQLIEVPFNISKGDRFFVQAFKGLLNFFSLRHILEDLQIDVVHTNDIRNHIQWMFASRFTCKHVVHLRTDVKNTVLWQLFFARSERVVAVSEYIKCKIYGPRVVRVYNPIDAVQHDHELEKAKIYKKLDLERSPNNKILIGYVGRLEITKGIKQFLNVSNGFEGAIFIVAGAGSCEHMLAEHNVHYLGFVSNMASLLSGLDIVVLPSQSEGFGRVLVEAAMQGCRIVASDIPAHHEAAKSVSHCKFFSVGDDFECATQIRNCLEELKIECARDNHVNTKLFDPVSHAESILEVYKSTL